MGCPKICHPKQKTKHRKTAACSNPKSKCVDQFPTPLNNPKSDHSSMCLSDTTGPRTPPPRNVVVVRSSHKLAACLARWAQWRRHSNSNEICRRIRFSVAFRKFFPSFWGRHETPADVGLINTTNLNVILTLYQNTFFICKVRKLSLNFRLANKFGSHKTGGAPPSQKLK